jgi:hypothetical protein
MLKQADMTAFTYEVRQKLTSLGIIEPVCRRC